MSLSPTLTLDADFPGGNILVDRIDGDTVHLRPDLRDTAGHWFYWYFRIRGAEGRALRFVFCGGLCIGARGPAVSRDDGESWTWLESSVIPDNEAFSYAFGPEERDLRFAFCLPYTRKNWKSFTPTLPALFQQSTLTLSPQKRPVPLLFSEGNANTPLIILTARHHCCETSPNFVLEGLLSNWPSEAPADLAVIPFVDLDGVEAGDQGKNRQPHDHNRDYAGEGLYPETRALRQWIEAVAKPFIALDLHCPYVREGDSETVYLVGSADPDMAARQARFGDILETLAEGLPYSRANDVPFGTKWNVPGNYKTGLSFAAWAGQQPDCLLASTLEIPYANAQGTPVTPETCRRFGASLGKVLLQAVDPSRNSR